MIGFILSTITATCTASKDLYVKSATKKYDRKTILWALFVFASLLLSICFTGAVLYFGSLPELKTQFWIALILDVPLLILANHFYIKALKRSEMSFCLPLLSFTPIGIVPIAAIFLGEKPTILSLLGICLIIVGSFFLGVKKLKDGLLEPIRNILKDKGAVYMMTTAFIWSVTSVIDKFGIKGSVASPFMQSLTWATTKTILIVIVLTIIFVYQKQKSRDILAKPEISKAGVFYGLEQFVQMWAVAVWDVAYVNSIKRVSILFSLVVGKIKFKEKVGPERIVAAVLMLLGTVMIFIFS